MNIATLQHSVREELHRRGFEVVRFTLPPLGEARDRFQKWLDQGFQGKMDYLPRRRDERQDPHRLFPELQSIIVLAHSYDSGLANTQDPKEGNISRYAWGEDYHRVLEEKLNDFRGWLTEQSDGVKCFSSVDASPVMEKAWAQKAGLGWMGKHTNIIHPESGSYFFLSVLLTNLPFQADPEEQDHCGTCEKCIQVCPTGAIVAPYVLDARLCISYLTIELRGPIPRALRPLIGNRIFGCDDCQEVCPWNRFSRPTTEPRFLPRSEIRNRPLQELIQIDRQTFRNLFWDSAVSRARWKGFIRNVLVAIGNSGQKSLAPLVREKLFEQDSLVRGHAVWAYARLLDQKALPLLMKIRSQEKDQFVLEEIEYFISSIRNEHRTPSPRI